MPRKSFFPSSVENALRDEFYSWMALPQSIRQPPTLEKEAEFLNEAFKEKLNGKKVTVSMLQTWKRQIRPDEFQRGVRR